MTPDNRLQIIEIIVQFTAPILAVLLGWRLSQPKQTPATSPPRSGRQRGQGIGGWLRRVFTSPWPFIVLIVFNLIDLALAIRSTKPLNRWGVLSIAYPIAAILTNFVFLAYLSLLKSTTSLADTFRKYAADQSDFDRSLLDEIKTGYHVQSDVNQQLLDTIKTISTDQVDVIKTISANQSDVNQTLLDAIAAVARKPPP